MATAVQRYASFESGLRELAIAGNLDRGQETAVGDAIRQAALQVNQLQETLLGDVKQLMDEGMPPERAANMVGLLSKTATVTNTDMTDMAKMTSAFNDALKIGDGKAMESAFSLAAAGASSANLELKEIAKIFPDLARSFAEKGMTGPEAIKDIIASMAVAKSSGTSDDAATTITSLMSSMTNASTINHYEKAGIHYASSMNEYVASGRSQYEALLLIANEFIDKKGPEFKQQWAVALAKGDGDAQQKLMASSGLSEVFSDTQTVSHLLSMRQNWGQYQAVKAEMSVPDAEASLNASYAKRNDTLEARWHHSQVIINEMAISIGSALEPALISLSDSLLPLMSSFAKWLSTNPELVANIAMLVGGIVALKTIVLGCMQAVTKVISSFLGFIDAITELQRKWRALKAVFLSGGALNGVTKFFRLLGRGAFSLARILGGALLRGLGLAGRAVLFLGRALMMNPIGLMITGIAVAAYLIYRYWSPISSFFKRLWSQIKTAFSGGIGSVARLITNWSPLGLFYKAFAGVMKYFGIDMPKNFTDFGGNLIRGLVSGIGNALTAAKEMVVNFGNSIAGWFKETLGIHSPSVVFAGFGDNIAEGAAIGINRSAPDAISASHEMATAMIPTPRLAISPTPGAAGVASHGVANAMLAQQVQRPLSSLTAIAPDVPALPENVPARGKPRRAAVAGQSSGVNVTFAPQITIKSAAPTTEGDISSALKISLHELEKMMERIMARRERREYA